ncbi:MAG: aminopeptidase P family protein [Candidatus Thorarchaeota archaeon]|nr:aminopeptidase P family protein [Candidatus Thorarchaeota archaeon]
MLDSKVYKTRMSRVQEFLMEQKLDFAFLTPSPSFQYLTGIQREMRERLIALIITPEGKPRIIAPSFEVSTLTQHTWIDDFLPWVEDENPYEVFFGCVGKTTNRYNAAFEDLTPFGVFRSVERVLKQIERIATISPLINSMRLVKSEDEVFLMEKAGHIINDAVTKGFELAEIGKTETELKRAVEDAVIQAGAASTFAAVQFGENSALPHAESGSRELRKNDIVLMDCGCSLGGYNTDMTRVGVVGTPTEEQEKIHSIVLHAERTAIEKLTPGMTCGLADGIARRIIEESGYGEQFTHRLGHGIGLEVHEPPYLVRGNSLQLQPGMTHSVEPGIYLEGKFGIRIEDLVVIRSNGAELLTFMPRDLYTIDH